MKETIKAATKHAVVFTVGMFLAVLLLVGIAVLVEVVNAARYDQDVGNLLARLRIYIGPTGKILPTANNKGYVGESGSQFLGMRAQNMTSDSSVVTLGQISRNEVGSTVAGPNGSTLQWVVNHTLAPVGAGRFMVARATSIKAVNPVGTTGLAANRAINDSLNSWIPATRGAKMLLAVRCVGTTATSDSVYVKGLDENGAQQTKKFGLVSGVTKTTLFISGTGKAAVKTYWSKIDSVSFAGIAAAPAGADSAALEAYPIGAVEVATSASAGNFVGVLVDSTASKGLGRVCIHGPVDGRVNALSTALTPGSMIELAGWGVGVTDAAATTAQNVATALEYSIQDSLLTRIFVEKY